jgi:translocator protein
MEMSNILKLIISLLACFVAAGIGSLFTFKAIPVWYAGLKKPPHTPPNRAFRPVWTTLYILMAIAVFLVWREGLTADGVLLAFVLFWVQLAINAVWSIIFFGRKSPGWAVPIIVLLWVLIVANIVASFRVSVWAGALLVPYIVWVSIASYLNIGVWLLNRHAARVKSASPEE